MAKELAFEDHTAIITDADGDERTHVISAAIVTKETAMVTRLNERNEVVTSPREVSTISGARQLHENDVVVRTSNPNVFDVHSSDTFKETGYERKNKGDDARSNTTDASVLSAKGK